jgi:hypothetical protein
MKEFVLSEPVTMDFAGYLRNFGEVEILSLMGKSFLSFEKPRFISVKGVTISPQISSTSSFSTTATGRRSGR